MDINLIQTILNDLKDHVEKKNKKLFEFHEFNLKYRIIRDDDKFCKTY